MTFEDMLAKNMKDPEFRKEFEALETEYAIKSMILQAIKEKNLTQEQLSKGTGMTEPTTKESTRRNFR